MGINTFHLFSYWKIPKGINGNCFLELRNLLHLGFAFLCVCVWFFFVMQFRKDFRLWSCTEGGKMCTKGVAKIGKLLSVQFHFYHFMHPFNIFQVPKVLWFKWLETSPKLDPVASKMKKRTLLDPVTGLLKVGNFGTTSILYHRLCWVNQTVF